MTELYNQLPSTSKTNLSSVKNNSPSELSNSKETNAKNKLTRITKDIYNNKLSQ